MDCKILTTIHEIESIKNAWDALLESAQGNIFASYGFFDVWFRNIGLSKNIVPHVAACWRDGRLVGIMPMVVYRKRGLRLLRWVGHNVYFTSLCIAEEPKDIDALWEVVSQSSHYDFAEIKSIVRGSHMEAILSRLPLAKVVEVGIERCVSFNSDNGAQFLNATDFSKGAIRNKRKRLHKTGNITFTMYDNDTPPDIVENLIKHKFEWCKRVGLAGPSFENKEYLYDILNTSAKMKRLHLGCLRCDDNQIGFIICFNSGKTLYFYLVANDDGWRKHSPGIITNIYAIAWAAEQGFDEYNFMEGYYSYKDELSNDYKEHLTCVYCRTARGIVGYLMSLFLYSRIFKTIKNIICKPAYAAHEQPS